VDRGEYANWTTHPNNPARVDVAQSAPAQTAEPAEAAAHADGPALAPAAKAA
jgi:dihydropyrimidine dehydrogenase (NAD+) subunit PreA